MRPPRHLTRSYLEITTASFLAWRGNHRQPARPQPVGSLLVVVPEDNPRIRSCLLRIARSYTARGGKAVIHQVGALDKV